MEVRTSETLYEIPIFSGRMKRRIGMCAVVFAASFFYFNIIGLRGSIRQALIIAGALISMAAYWRLGSHMDRCVWRLQKHCIRRVMFGAVKDISYEEIIEALQSRKVKITADAFLIPKKRGCIAFYYEVGNADIQKEIKQSYEFLAEKIPVQMPELSQKVIQQMDRSFLYRKDRRNCSIIMLLVSFLMIYADFESVMISILIVGAGQYIQFSRLNKLFKGIYFGKKAEKSIQQIFEPYTNVKLRKVKASYVQMVIVVLMTAALNLFWLRL